MLVLKACHFYVNRNPKNSKFINEIMPVRDLEVSKIMFDQFQDTTVDNVYIDDRKEHRNALRDILESTGAPK
jgi:hypothetical protein